MAAKKKAAKAVGAEVSVEEARSVLMRAYYATVERWAKDLAERLAKGEWDSEEAFNEAFDEETDGSMVYTREAYDCIYASENSESARDEMNDMGMTLDSPTFLNAWAVLAFRLDIREHSQFPDVSAHFDER